MSTRSSPLVRWGLAVSACAVAVLTPAASAQTVAIVGVSTGIDSTTGALPSRRNINDVYNEAGPHWDLLVQAISSFQSSDMNNYFSYYQVAGIHGLPFATWDGVEQVSGGSSSGYCPHGQTTFVTWHRPYLALFEQGIAAHAQQIVQSYPSETRATYQAAADALRLPFWDWAVNVTLPQAVTEPTITYNGPNGASTMNNPLYSYSFPNYPFNGGGFGGSLANFAETKRCVDTSEGSAHASDEGGADQAMASRGSLLKDKVYAVFTQSTSFENMATIANKGASFEDPHNYVHNDIACLSSSGRIGHMGELSYSAFDPIFFFHHANVDRLFTMWQAVYYNDTMFTTSQIGNSVYSTPAGNMTADSALRPFWNGRGRDSTDDNAFHTSRSVESARTFGYTYPEVNDWSQSKDELANAVRASVNQLYGDAANANTRRSTQHRHKARELLSSILSATDFSVELSVERSELPLPCTIDIELLDSDDNTTCTKIGGTVLLQMPMAGVSYTVVPLRRTLLAELEAGVSWLTLGLLGGSSVVDQLQQRLRVSIHTPNGTVVAAESVASLNVEIQQRTFEAAASSTEFPQFGPIQPIKLDLGLLL